MNDCIKYKIFFLVLIIKFQIPLICVGKGSNIQPIHMITYFPCFDRKGDKFISKFISKFNLTIRPPFLGQGVTCQPLYRERKIPFIL